MWVPFLCCWFVELFLTFVLCWFFSVPVNRKVPDWLPLRLVSLIYPKNGNNTGGEGTGHVWVQHISLTYSGRILPRHKEGIVSGNAGHLLWWRADKTFGHLQALQCFGIHWATDIHPFFGGKLQCFSPFLLYLSTFPPLRSNSIAYFLRKLSESLLGCDFPCIFL